MTKNFLKRGVAVSLTAIVVLTATYGVNKEYFSTEKDTTDSSGVASEQLQTENNNVSDKKNAIVIDEVSNTVSIDVSQYTDNKEIADTVAGILAINPDADNLQNEPVKLLTMDELKVASDDLSSEGEVMGRNVTVSDVDESKTEAVQQSIKDYKDMAVQTSVSNYELPVASYGIDVSKWQGDINWAAVKASGISFAMVKIAGRSTAMDGELYIDSYADRNIRGAQAAGIQVGVYFFSQATNVIESYQEACLVVNLLKNYNISFPVAFDWESASGYRAEYAPKDQLSMNLIATTFCNTVETYGYNAMIYACASDFYSTYDSTTLCAKYKAWMARYYNDYYYTSNIYMGERSLPMETFTYKMWQFGVSNVVAGINGYVDMDLGFFTYAPIESPMAINVQAPVLSGTCGQYYNLLTGVTAVSHAGTDATAYVRCTVTNIFGVEVTPQAAFTVPGTYTVKYSLVDATGLYKQVCVMLVIQ